MSEINKLLAEKPKNIGSEALSLALARKKKIDESKFAKVYPLLLYGKSTICTLLT